jgi:hypothetical protein
MRTEVRPGANSRSGFGITSLAQAVMSTQVDIVANGPEARLESPANDGGARGSASRGYV